MDGLLLAITQFVMHRINHLLDAVRNHLHVNIRCRWKSRVAQHALSVLDRTLGLAEGGHGPSDHLKC